MQAEQSRGAGVETKEQMVCHTETRAQGAVAGFLELQPSGPVVFIRFPCLSYIFASNT